MSEEETIIITDTIFINKHRDGFRLYDTTRGMNLSMYATSVRQALTEALEYYQKRLTKIETNYYKLRKEVRDFVDLVNSGEEV